MKGSLKVGTAGCVLVALILLPGCDSTPGEQRLAPLPTVTMHLDALTPSAPTVSPVPRQPLVDPGATATKAVEATETALVLASLSTQTPLRPIGPVSIPTSATLPAPPTARSLDQWGEAIREYTFAGPEDAWIVLNRGALLHTSDRGKHWEQQYDQAAQIQFVDKDLGWLTDRDTILGTQDGGQSWQTQFDLAMTSTPATDRPPYYVTKAGGVSAISFVSAQRGWASTSVGLLTTTDGGKHWERVNSNKWVVLARFTDDQHGWGYAGGGAEDPMLSHTTDGGQTWLTWQQGGPGCNWYKTGALFSFAGPDAGWAICIPSPGTDYADPLGMVKTTDGGQSWPAVESTEPDKGIVPHDLVGTASVEGLFFLDDNDGWVSALAPAFVPNRSSSQHILRRTQDGGHSWQTMAGLNVGLSQLQFENSTVGYGVNGPMLLGTTDGGEHWEAVYSP
jgi:photosystem II stability/assembly factor-like uncharacterized protein